MAYLFIQQQTFTINKSCVLGIRIGIVYFVVFSLFGGYVAQMPGHTVGGNDGGAGLAFVNWSTIFGDVRIAHFFGMHSLQLIPLLALFLSSYLQEKASIKLIWLFSIVYFCFIIFVMLQALLGKPFIH